MWTSGLVSASVIDGRSRLAWGRTVLTGAGRWVVAGGLALAGDGVAFGGGAG